MADAYDTQTFSRNLLPKGLKNEQKDMIDLAVGLGWTMYITGPGAVTIAAPDGSNTRHHFYPGRKSLPSDRLKRSILKHADPLRLEMVHQAAEQGKKGNEVIASLMIDTVLKSSPEVVMARPEDEAAKTPHVKEAAATPPKPVKPVKLVKEFPMLAKGSEGVGYNSETTIERHWSDGSVDYKCTRCDYTSPNRLGPRGHWQKHVREDEATRIKDRDTFKTDVPGAAHYKPRQARVDALAEYLRELGYTVSEMDPEEVALAALTWVNEQSRKSTPLAAEREELHDDDILGRIRSLLGVNVSPEQESEIARLRAENLEMAQAVTEALQAAEDATQRAQRAHDTLRALTELAQEASGGE